MLHTDETVTCPIINATDNYHFEGRCEDHDVRRMSRMSLERIEDHHAQGRLTRDQLDAYRLVWALLSPTGSMPHYASQPNITDPDVRRIARKLCRIRDFEIPAVLVGDSAATDDESES